MKYITVKEYAARHNLTEDKVRKLCANGDIEGATKIKGIWNIPDDADMYDLTATAKTTDSQTKAQPVAVNNVNPLKNLARCIVLMLVGVTIVVCGIALCVNDAAFFGVFMILFGGLFAYGGWGGTVNNFKDLKVVLAQEKEANNKKTRNKLIKIGVVVGVIVCTITTATVLGFGMYDAYYLNLRADNLVKTEIDEEVFEKIDEFDKKFQKETAVAKLFYTKADAVKAFKEEVNKSILTRAEEVEAGINALTPSSEISSVEQFNECLRESNSLILSDYNEFDKRAREKVKNYNDLALYQEALEKIRIPHYNSCRSCGGGGGRSCGTCGGSGRMVVTWYEYGDWGDKSYTSYKCTKCNGRGRYSCGSCGGDGKTVSYTYTFEQKTEEQVSDK